MKMELLKNNSNEMATVVETFLTEETVQLIYDGEELEKWNRIVEELGLKGQTHIVKKDKSPIPFMHLKTSMCSVFETLCPRKVDVKDYNISPIPVEILDLIALSVKEEYFYKIQIWYDEKSPDPVCVGFKYDTEEHAKAGYEWYAEKYLLGKWGDVKHSFSTLIEMAKKRFLVEQTASYKQQLKHYTRALEDIENEAITKFGTDHSQGLGELPF